jgi:hypothetical protein
LVIPAFLPPPVVAKLIGGFGLSLIGFSAAEVPGVLFLADRDGAELFALWRSKLCNSLELAPAAVAGLAVVPMGALFFAAFGGAERLTLYVLFCCPKPLALMPTSTTATANETLIFKNPQFFARGTLSARELRATYWLDARTLP